MDILFVIGRILYGGFFLVHGLGVLRGNAHLSDRLRSKHIPYPRILLAITAFLLAGGGLGVLTGLYTNLALTLIIVSLTFASFTLNDYWNVHEPREISLEMANFIRNMALIGAALMMYSFLTPWEYTL